MVLAAGVAVTVVLLAIILMLHHSGREVVPATWTPPPGWEEVPRKTAIPDGSGIFQKYEQMSGQELAKIWEPPPDSELVPESEIHEPHSWLRQRSSRQWCSKSPDDLSDTIVAFRVQFPNESWTPERDLEYTTLLAADAFHEIAKVAQRKGSSLPVWTPADIKLGIPPPPDYREPNPSGQQSIGADGWVEHCFCVVGMMTVVVTIGLCFRSLVGRYRRWKSPPPPPPKE